LTVDHCNVDLDENRAIGVIDLDGVSRRQVEALSPIRDQALIAAPRGGESPNPDPSPIGHVRYVRHPLSHCQVAISFSKITSRF